MSQIVRKNSNPVERIFSKTKLNQKKINNNIRNTGDNIFFL